jgi:hypothetical protein
MVVPSLEIKTSFEEKWTFDPSSWYHNLSQKHWATIIQGHGATSQKKKEPDYTTAKA